MALRAVSNGTGRVRTGARASGGFIADYYVDSSRADDSGDGLTVATAFKTLTAASAVMTNGLRVGLKAGSLFTSSLDQASLSNVTIGVYGAGAAPVINCADQLTGWTLVGGTSFTYTKTGVVLAATAEPSQISFQQDDVLMQRVGTDPGTTEMAAGTYYVSADSGTVTFKMRASDSSDPTISGKVYSYSARLVGIRLGANAIVSGIETKNNRLNDGSLVVGANSSVSYCTARNGHKHNMLVGYGSTVRNNTIIEGHKYDDTGIMLVIYSPGAVAGMPDTYVENNVFTCRGLLAAPVECIYGHTSGAAAGTNVYIRFNTFRDCYGSIDASNAGITGDVYFDSNYITLTQTASLPYQISSAYIVGGKYFRSNQVYMPEPFATTYAICDKMFEANKAVIFDDNLIFAGPYFNWVLGATNGSPDVTARRNKVWTPNTFIRLGGATNILRDVSANEVAASGYNVQAFNTLSVTSCDHNHWTGTFNLAGTEKSWSEWQALGYDLNSDAAGDARLASVPSGGALLNDLADYPYTLLHVSAQATATITQSGGFVSQVVDTSRPAHVFTLDAPTPASDKVALTTSGGYPWFVPQNRGGLKLAQAGLSSQAQMIAAVVQFDATVDLNSTGLTLASFNANDQQSVRFGNYGATFVTNEIATLYHGGNSGYGYTGAYSLPANTPTLVVFYWDPLTNSVQFRINGGFVGYMTPGSPIVKQPTYFTKTEAVLLLQSQQNSNRFQGKLGEILVTAACSSDHLAAVEAALLARWGIAEIADATAPTLLDRAGNDLIDRAGNSILGRLT